ncbi:MAG: hypothetical protein R3Y59_08260 [bacterium]
MKKIYTFILAMLFALPSFGDETTIYLNVENCWWTGDGNLFGVYYYGGTSGDGFSDIMELVQGEDYVYKTTINADFEKVIFIRLKNGATSVSFSNIWKQTSDLSVDGNYYIMTSYDGGGSWNTYTEVTYSSITVDAPSAAFVNESLTITATPDGFTNPTITFEVKTPSATSTTTCTMPYTPTETGTYSFTVTATEESNSVSETVDIEVFKVSEPITIKAKCTEESWGNVGIYWWDDYGTSVGSYPAEMIQIDDSDWYTYDISGYYGDDVSIVFTDGDSWNNDAAAKKTVDITGVSSSKTYVIYDGDDDNNNFTYSELEISERKMTFYYFLSGEDYQTLYVWQEKSGDSYDYKLTDTWPGDIRDSEETYDEVSWNKLTLQNEFAENYTKIGVIINNDNGTASESVYTTDAIDITSYLYSYGWLYDNVELWVNASGVRLEYEDDGTANTTSTITFRAELRDMLEGADYTAAYNDGTNPVFDTNKTYSAASYEAYVEVYESAYETFAAYASSQDEIDETKSALEEAYDALEQITYTETVEVSAETEITESTVVSDLTISEDGSLIVADDVEIIVDELTLNSYINDVATIDFSTGSITASTLKFVKTVDDEIFYYFSLPFDCEFSDITAVDAGGNTLTSDMYGTDNSNWVWVIREYNEATYANNWNNTSVANSWTDVAYGSELKANKGYAIGFGYYGTSYTERENILECTFTFNGYDVELKNDESLAVTATVVTLDDEDNREKANLRKGWNLVSVPNYAVYSNSISYTSSVNSENNNSYMSVSYPNADGYGYYQFNTAEGDFGFTPFYAFLVQVPDNGTISFDYTANLSKAPSAPMLAASAATEDYIVVKLMQNDEVVDKTTAIFVEKDMPNYTVGCDLEKIFTSEIPQIYILDKGYDLAVNTRTYKASDIIYLEIYTPSAGEYTLSLESNQYMIEDVNSSEVSNSVTFTTEAAGYITGEYRVITSSYVTTGNDCVDTTSDNLSVYTQSGSIVVENVNSNAPIYLYTTTGQLVNIYKSGQSNITINGLNSGIYILSVEGQSYKLIVNN